jgi:hypothetical protein
MKKRSGMAAVMVAIFAGFLVPARSDAIQACVNAKTGATRTLLSGGVCKKTEQSVPMPLQLVDEAGKFVGPAETFAGTDYADVNLSINAEIYDLGVDSITGFTDYDLDAGPISELFTTEDCSGTPLLAAFQAEGYPLDVPNPLVRTAFGDWGPFVFNGVLYYPTSLSLLSIQSSGSYSDPTQPFSQCSKFSSPRAITVGPISTFNLSNLGFHPPFHLQ